jgi:hypothetical protein
LNDRNVPEAVVDFLFLNDGYVPIKSFHKFLCKFRFTLN